jgi:hypothetical protein
MPACQHASLSPFSPLVGAPSCKRKPPYTLAANLNPNLTELCSMNAWHRCVGLTPPGVAGSRGHDAAGIRSTRCRRALAFYTEYAADLRSAPQKKKKKALSWQSVLPACRAHRWRHVVDLGRAWIVSRSGPSLFSSFSTLRSIHCCQPLAAVQTHHFLTGAPHRGFCSGQLRRPITRVAGIRARLRLSVSTLITIEQTTDLG